MKTEKAPKTVAQIVKYCEKSIELCNEEMDGGGADAYYSVIYFVLSDEEE